MMWIIVAVGSYLMFWSFNEVLNNNSNIHFIFLAFCSALMLCAAVVSLFSAFVRFVFESSRGKDTDRLKQSASRMGAGAFNKSGAAY